MGGEVGCNHPDLINSYLGFMMAETEQEFEDDRQSLAEPGNSGDGDGLQVGSNSADVIICLHLPGSGGNEVACAKATEDLAPQ